MIFYITKYALTQGIVEMHADDFEKYKIDDGYLWLTPKKNFPTGYRAGEWYTNKFFAIEDAERRRAKKIESLKRQIEKLEKIEFK